MNPQIQVLSATMIAVCQVYIAWSLTLVSVFLGVGVIAGYFGGWLLLMVVLNYLLACIVYTVAMYPIGKWLLNHVNVNTN